MSLFLPLGILLNLACSTADKEEDSSVSDTAESSEPSSQPSSEPSSQPSSEPSSQPSSEPSSQPSSEPSSQPSSEPSSQPTSDPTSEPTSEPSEEPIASYTGGYNVNPCSAATTGYGVGQVAGDFALMDQYGETLHLSDFCGNAVVLVSAAFW